jgi:plasmid stabilization system protein ParE
VIRTQTVSLPRASNLEWRDIVGTVNATIPRRPHVEPPLIISEALMPRGDKSSYTDKQKRQAEHIEEGYENRGVSDTEAERRAWATVNKETHGGKKSGSGRGRAENHEPSRKGGHIGGSSQSSEERSRAAKKGWATRRRS